MKYYQGHQSLKKVATNFSSTSSDISHPHNSPNMYPMVPQNPFQYGNGVAYHYPANGLYKSTLEDQRPLNIDNSSNPSIISPQTHHKPFKGSPESGHKQPSKARPFIDPKEIRTAPTNSRKIYVCFSSKTLSEDKILKGFSKFGEIEQVEICAKRKKGAFTFGFIEFRSIKATQEALKVSKVVISGVSIRVKPMEKILQFNEHQVQKCLKDQDLAQEANSQQLLSSDATKSKREQQLLMIEKLKRQNILRESKKTAKDNSRIHLILKLKHRIEEEDLMRFNLAGPFRYDRH